MPVTEPTEPPSRALMLLEGRAVAELGAFFSMLPLLRRAPRGVPETDVVAMHEHEGVVAA